ncbi:phenylacetic acid degradation protein PaaN [Actinokineospora sp.]|uniref:phenylacetic acid degradation protein PaaN n=1 Tax=Actinokineospora sp. TaxID=1872133 RepID=UPI003D6C3B13
MTRRARHRAILDRALEVIATRGYWSPFPEDPKAYGDAARAAGERAFHALLGTPMEFDQPGVDGMVGPGDGGERSPYGMPLGISYPHVDPTLLLPAMAAAMPAWRDAGPEERALVCLEILDRIHARSFEFAYAAMHTSGHGFLMALHAGAAHAQDRALEAIAHAYAEQSRLPTHAVWTKPRAGTGPLVMAKTFRTVPRGISLLIGCATFPAWNGYPGLFASLATGNPVLVKPHHSAVLPLALTVRIAREVLREHGFDPNLVCLAAERSGEGLGKVLAARPEVRIVDYAGSGSLGPWLATNVRHAQVYAFTSGVNSILIESTSDYRGMLANLAFTLCLYSGQLPGSPQNLLIPRDGIDTDQGHRGFTQVTDDLAAAVEELLAQPDLVFALLGAIVSPSVRTRLRHTDSGALGKVLLSSRQLTHPEFPDAAVHSPVLVELDADGPADRATLLAGHFGPVCFAVAVESAQAGVDLVRDTVATRGAMITGGYTTSAAVESALVEACADVGVSLALNLTGDWYITQSAVYSDLHGTGANPATTASFCDAGFVADRFRTVQVCRAE